MRCEKNKKFLSWNFEILNHNSDVFLRWMQCASVSLEPVWGFLAALWDFLTLFQENEIFKGWKLQTDVMRRFFYSVKLWINFCSGRNISPPTSLKMILISVFFFFRAVVVRSGALCDAGLNPRQTAARRPSASSVSYHENDVWSFWFVFVEPGEELPPPGVCRCVWCKHADDYCTMRFWQIFNPR